MCAPGTSNLLRAESRTSAAPTGGTPVMACLQVAIGLDTDEDGAIDDWDNGGAKAALYDSRQLRKNLKQVRLYALVQSGGRDADYTWPSAKIRVGEGTLGAGGTGRDVTLTAAQRKYRWRMLTMKITPRNIR